ncbi:hypothetical protein A1D29_10785 [Pasteurellaceae bacterium Orientalotternb1]|nr:hypothetical protein A1D29_10785 [Pasteurellaceae bacterium Orientalotternb1]
MPTLRKLNCDLDHKKDGRLYRFFCRTARKQAVRFPKIFANFLEKVTASRDKFCDLYRKIDRFILQSE